MALTQNSQNILSNVHNFEQSKSVPATSQIYSPNDSPPEVNVVPTPKTDVAPPTSSQSPYSPASQSPASQSQTSLQGNEQMNQSWTVVLVVLLVFIAVAIGAVKKVRSTSYNHPPSMKQLAILRSTGYSGPMPTSSKEAWDIIADIKKR